MHFKKFSGKYFLVFGKEEGKHKFRKTQATTQIAPSDDRNPRSRSTDLHLGSRDLPRRIFLSDLSAYIQHVAISDLPLSPLIAISIRRDLAKARSRSTARSRRREIAINGTISRRRDRDQWRYLTTVRSCSLLLLSRTRALSLSLSLIFRKCFEGKIEV